MSFLTDFTPADVASHLDRLVDAACDLTKPLNWTTPLNVSTLISLTFRVESLKIAVFTFAGDHRVVDVLAGPFLLRSGCATHDRHQCNSNEQRGKILAKVGHSSYSGCMHRLLLKTHCGRSEVRRRYGAAHWWPRRPSTRQGSLRKCTAQALTWKSRCRWQEHLPACAGEQTDPRIRLTVGVAFRAAQAAFS